METEKGFAKIPIDRYDHLAAAERAMNKLYEDPESFIVFDRYHSHLFRKVYASTTKDEVIASIRTNLEKCGATINNYNLFYQTLRESKIFRIMQWFKIIPKFPGE